MSSRSIPSRPVIAPSMLKCDFGNLEDEIRALESAGAELLHLDVMDGHFVPNLSYGAMVIERIRSRTDLVLDAHLMISEPERYLDDYLDAGCDWITIHIEAVPQPQSILETIRSSNRRAGLAVNPGTPLGMIEPFADLVDLVLIMSVEPGFGGQAFQPQAIEKVAQARSNFPADTLISIDGGIGPDTIPLVAPKGVDVYVAGSSIFDNADYEVAIRDMAELAQRHALPLN